MFCIKDWKLRVLIFEIGLFTPEIRFEKAFIIFFYKALHFAVFT